MVTRWLAGLGLPHLLAALIAAGTFALFWPAVGHPFMLIDDADYITAHPLVPLGLTWTGLGYAFVAKHSANWHPLTTLSHMLDCQVFGLSPAGPHLVNILLHALNGALLFWVLRKLTGSLWRSGIVAAFFAVHPLRVESVAWISERKDVLSAFFFLLTIWAYARYAQKAEGRRQKAEIASTQPSTLSYCLALLFFTLAVLSKPMVVTLPFVLLLLDFWPLRRFRPATRDFRLVWPLLREKIPFFLLSLVLSYITFQVQRGVGAMSTLEELPFSTRILNTAVSYSRYLGKIFWPVDLAPIYPYNLGLAPLAAAPAVALLAGVSWLAYRLRQRSPWFLIGWLWFLGILVPTIGLVQVGSQAYADRYTYLPSIGILVLAVWTAASLAAPSAWAWRGLGVLAAVALLPLSVATRIQLHHWKNTEELMRYTLRVAGPSEMTHRCLAFMLARNGKLEEAAKEFRAALQLAPNSFPAMLGFGAVYASQGKDAEAEQLFRQALAANPDVASHFQLADFLQDRGRLDEAKVHYLQGLALAPYYAKARHDLGNIYAKQKNWPAAREQFERALKLNPKAAETHQNLGTLLALQGSEDAAVKHYQLALLFKPDFAEAHVSLGEALARGGDLTAAESHFEAALKCQTNNARAHFALAGVFAAQRQDTQAVLHLRQAVRLDPQWVDPLNNLAWLLATHKDPRLRDGPEAVRLAHRALELGKTNDWERFDTLAAAQAEAGQFQEAVAAARQALDLTVRAGQTNEVNGVSNRLELYRKGLPYREP